MAGDTMANGARDALIVASSDYADPKLRQLRAPASDARALEAVLRDPKIGGFEVRTLVNRPNQEVALAVEDFFADRQPDDMLLAHFSCHGIKDEEGELYFAMADSLLHRLAATAVAANFVNRRMNRSRSKRVVLLLDCCYAGAFERGMTARAGGGVGIEAQFAGGQGRAVVTASDAMQYAYEGGELADTGELGPSVFTSALVSGLQTGEADRDQDGQVGLDELYEYIYDKVHAVTPNQTPCKWTYGIRGELFIARRSRPVTTPSPLPDDIQGAIESRLASVRLGAVQELELLLHGRHEGLALAARLALQQLAGDDSHAVSAAATAALGVGEPAAVPPRLEPSTTSVEFGPLAQHSQSPELSIQLGNTGGGNLNAHAATEASWVRLRQADDELYVTVDTGTVGEYEGAVAVDSDGGSATILVKASVVSASETSAPIPGLTKPDQDCITRQLTGCGLANAFRIPSDNWSRLERVRELINHEVDTGRRLRLAASSGFSYLHPNGPVWADAGLGRLITTGVMDMVAVLESPFSDFALTRALANGVAHHHWQEKMPPEDLVALLKYPNVKIRVTDRSVNCSLFLTSQAIYYDPYLWALPFPDARTENKFWVLEFTKVEDRGRDCYALLERHFDFLLSYSIPLEELLHAPPSGSQCPLGKEFFDFFTTHRKLALNRYRTLTREFTEKVELLKKDDHGFLGRQ